jgi:hypothetical protein
MALKVRAEKGKYSYNQVDVEKLTLQGSHATIASITKEQALELAQSLIAAVMDKNSDDVRVDFELKEPTRIGDTPEVCLYFGSGVAPATYPKLHWAMVEGHLLYSLSDDYLDTEAN